MGIFAEPYKGHQRPSLLFDNFGKQDVMRTLFYMLSNWI